MESRENSFAVEVDRQIQSSGEDDGTALWRLSVVQQAFERTAEGLKRRMAELPMPPSKPIESTPSATDAGPEEPTGPVMPQKWLYLFWPLLGILSLGAFVLGYWAGCFH